MPVLHERGRERIKDRRIAPRIATHARGPPRAAAAGARGGCFFLNTQTSTRTNKYRQARSNERRRRRAARPAVASGSVVGRWCRWFGCPATSRRPRPRISLIPDRFICITARSPLSPLLDLVASVLPGWRGCNHSHVLWLLRWGTGRQIAWLVSYSCTTNILVPPMPHPHRLVGLLIGARTTTLPYRGDTPTSSLAK